MMLAAGGLLVVAACRPADEVPDSALSDVKGRIVAIADGDFLASTYGDQVLAPLEPAYRDRLLVWSDRASGSPPREIEISNSVTSPPEILAVSPDARFAYVVERLGQRAPGLTRTSQLSAGGRLTAVSLADPLTIVGTADLGDNPEAIDLRADGRMIAAVSNTADRSWVHLVPVADGRLGAPVRFDLATLGVTGSATGPRGGVTASAVFWSPDGRGLAVTLNTQNRVAFFRLEGPDTAPRLTPWGAPVATGRDPFTGRFTPDGRHFLSLDWGRDFQATSIEGRLPSSPSRISVIRLSPGGDHRRLGDAPTDLSSEGIAVSPRGDLVAAVNMRGTALDPASARYTPNATVTLLHFDAAQGTLTPIDQQTFPGILPEGASFDRAGRTLLVTAFQVRGRSGGGLQAFAIEGEGPGARLRSLGLEPTPHGVHHVVVR